MSALLLFIVFFFTHAAKALHTHDHHAVNFLKSTHQIEKLNHCSICDYHLAKDAEVVAGVISDKCTHDYVVHFISYKSRTTSSTGLNYSDRGPPSVA